MRVRYAITVFFLCALKSVVHAACPADVIMPVEQEIKTVDAVVVGRAVSHKYIAAGPGGDWVEGTYYTVKVSSVEYGSPAKEITLFSENSSGRFPMVQDKAYLIFVSSCDGVQYVDAKGNSGPLSKHADDLRTVRNLKPHVQ